MFIEENFNKQLIDCQFNANIIKNKIILRFLTGALTHFVSDAYFMPNIRMFRDENNAANQ